MSKSGYRKYRESLEDNHDDNNDTISENNEIKNPILLKRMEKLEKKRKKKKHGRKYVKYIILLACIAIPLFLFGIAVVEGDSMKPDLHSKDYVFYMKHPKEYKSEEIVLIDKEGENKTYIKRIIGVPGDKIQITQDGKVIRNDIMLDSSEYSGLTEPGNVLKYPLYLSEGEYFVLGDNRENSKDSRTFGVVKEKELKGRVLILFGRKL